MKIEILSPHGFCGGVARAIKMAQEALAARGREGAGAATVYCLHEIVHSEQVVQELILRVTDSLTENYRTVQTIFLYQTAYHYKSNSFYLTGRGNS